MLLSQYLLNIVIDYCYVLLAEGMNSGGSEVGFSSTTTPTHYTKTYDFKRRKKLLNELNISNTLLKNQCTLPTVKS